MGGKSKNPGIRLDFGVFVILVPAAGAGIVALYVFQLTCLGELFAQGEQFLSGKRI
jgi:hypothetical protein